MLSPTIVRLFGIGLALSLGACVTGGGPNYGPSDGNDGGDGDDSGGTGNGSGGESNGDGGTSNGDGGTSNGDGGTGSGGENNGNGGTGGMITVTDCSSLPLCEDFEGGTVGSQPDPSVWSLRLDYGNNASPSLIVIDDSESHSGSKSVKIDGTSAQTVGIIYSASFPMDVFHLRAWMKVQLVQDAERDPVFIGIGQEENTEVRLRSFNRYITANNTSSDAVAPSQATSGEGCPSCTQLPTDWFCVEMYVNRPAEELSISVNGEVAVSVTDWKASTSSTMPPSIDQVRFGFMRLNGSAGTVWFDDIAIGPSPIGCD